MLNGSKWCNEMYKNDVPPQAMNNSETFTASEYGLLPYTVEEKEGNVNGNVLPHSACVHTNVSMHILLVQLFQIDFSRFRPWLLF